jgi:hypothetical protein
LEVGDWSQQEEFEVYCRFLVGQRSFGTLYEDFCEGGSLVDTRPRSCMGSGFH